MKKAWSVVLGVVFFAILLGAIAIGVGCLTGADLQQVYETMEGSAVADVIRSMIEYGNTGLAYARQYLADLPGWITAFFSAFFG